MSRYITNIVYVRKQGLEHYTEMIEWLKLHLRPVDYRYGGYLLWTTRGYSIFHFCDEESALLFKLAFGGTSDIEKV